MADKTVTSKTLSIELDTGQTKKQKLLIQDELREMDSLEHSHNVKLLKLITELNITVFQK